MAGRWKSFVRNKRKKSEMTANVNPPNMAVNVRRFLHQGRETLSNKNLILKNYYENSIAYRQTVFLRKTVMYIWLFYKYIYVVLMRILLLYIDFMNLRSVRYHHFTIKKERCNSKLAMTVSSSHLWKSSNFLIYC